MGWSNDQATTLDGQAVTYLNSTTTYSTGSVLAVDDDATFTINGLSPALGIVARAFSASDLPAAGTAAPSSATAATVFQVDLTTCVLGRVYLITTNPGFEVRKNDTGETGLAITYTEDGTAPTVASTALCRSYVTSPLAGRATPCPVGVSYTRRVATGQLRVLLSIWNHSATGATVASAAGGEKLELHIVDMGLDPLP